MMAFRIGIWDENIARSLQYSYIDFNRMFEAGRNSKNNARTHLL